MSDELQGRLEEAGKHFASKAYDACLRTLSACSSDDPKVTHNAAIVEYAKNAGNHRTVVAALDLPEPQRTKSQKTGEVTTQLVLRYDGQEIAYLNAACMHLHCGNTAEARTILKLLAAMADAFDPAFRVRVAIFLHLATRRTPANDDVSDTVNSLMSDPSVFQSDPALQKMMQLAFSDTSMLHSWYGGTKKTAADRAVYYNNLGVEAFADGKQAVACVFFSKAAAACDTATCHYLNDAVMYNAGLCSLARGEPQAALRPLLASQRSMCGSSVLWIRIAQAAVLVAERAMHNASVEAEQAHVAAQSNDYVDGKAPQGGVVPLPPTAVPASAAGALATAVRCLQNAMALLQRSGETLTEAARRNLSHGTAEQLDAALSLLAYTELMRGNFPAVAKCTSEYFVMQRDVPNATSAKAHAVMVCYAVEGLCGANRPAAALKLLQGIDLGGFVARGTPNATVEAMLVNMCVVHIMNGAWAKAQTIAQSVVARIAPANAQLLTAYLDLAMGNRAAARAQIDSIEPSRPMA